MHRRTVLGTLAASLLAPLPSISLSTTSPPNAEVYIIWPPDGAVIDGGKFWVRMGLRNMGIAPRASTWPTSATTTC